MYDYSNEVYLPCGEPVLSRRVRRQVLPNSGKAFLSRDIRIIPWLKGALIISETGNYFTEDEAVVLRLSEGISLGSGAISSIERQEIERFNAYGFISINNYKSACILFDEKLLKYRRLYEPSEFVNFSLSPFVIELDITNDCNTHCVHCSRQAGDQTGPRQNLDINVLKGLIDEIVALHGIYLIIMGGEPLVRPDLFEILDYASNKAIPYIKLSTNGINLSLGITRKLAKYLDNIQISLHGPNAGIHDYIAGRKGAFNRVMKGIDNVNEIGIPITISCTVMEYNRHYLEDIAELAHEYGASNLRFIAITKVGRGKKLKGLTHQDRKEIGRTIEKIRDTYSNSSLRLQVGGFPTPEPVKTNATFYGCPAGITHIHIFNNGSVNLCGSIEGNILGNWKEKKDLLYFWHHPDLKKLRGKLNCRCAYLGICSGPCKADVIHFGIEKKRGAIENGGS